MTYDEDGPRPVRRARLRATRGGRKGAKAAIKVARHDAGLLIDEAAQSRGMDRARDRRNGVMRAGSHPHRSDEERAKEKADRRAYRRRAAAAR